MNKKLNRLLLASIVFCASLIAMDGGGGGSSSSAGELGLLSRERLIWTTTYQQIAGLPSQTEKDQALIRILQGAMAWKDRRESIVSALYAGANPEAGLGGMGGVPMSCMCNGDDDVEYLKAILMLKADPNVNISFASYSPPLAFVETLAMAKVLVEFGAKIHFRSRGMGFLHCVAQNMDSEAELMQFGIDQDLSLNDRTDLGSLTPLHVLACTYYPYLTNLPNHRECFLRKARILIDNGVELDAKNSSGKTAGDKVRDDIDRLEKERFRGGWAEKQNCMHAPRLLESSKMKCDTKSVIINGDITRCRYESIQSN